MGTLCFKLKMGKTVIALALLVMAIVAVESKAIEKPESISGTKKSSKLPANPPDGKKENNPPGKLGWIFGEPPKGNAEKTLLAYLKAHPEQVKKFMSQVKAKGPAIEAYIKAHPEQAKKF